MMLIDNKTELNCEEVGEIIDYMRSHDNEEPYYNKKDMYILTYKDRNYILRVIYLQKYTKIELTNRKINKTSALLKEVK